MDRVAQRDADGHQIKWQQHISGNPKPPAAPAKRFGYRCRIYRFAHLVAEGSARPILEHEGGLPLKFIVRILFHLGAQICCRAATNHDVVPSCCINASSGSSPMNGIIYLVGLVVVVMAILSFFGLR